ncbi:MAG TPA: FliH/SctL family protein [Bryobacteraceae bacterium]|nr:FliH/SctL family protein [Bryobacteraceae bacterium]
MLCRILGNDSLSNDSPGITAPPWLRPRSSAEADAGDRHRPGRGEASSAELQRLAFRVEELTALLDRGAKDAWQQGFRAGDTAARESLQAEIGETTSTLAARISEIAEQRSETIKRAEADTVRLSIEIARRVLHREVSIDPSALSALVGAALEKLRNQEIYRVRIHPDLEKLLKSSLEQFGRSAAIEVLPDAALPRGGVTFEISRGALDASVDTQLREIERGLVDEIRTRS